MSNEKIDNRLIALIESTMNSNKRFKELEEKTGIAANRWQSLWHGRQRAMPDMIEVICRIFPEYAFWLIQVSQTVITGTFPSYQRSCRQQNSTE
jgi:hypothetical protein